MTETASPSGTESPLTTPPELDSPHYLGHEALLAKVIERDFIDYPTGWAIQAAGLTHTSSQCSAVQCLAFLCDCGAIDTRAAELRAEAAAQVLARRAELLSHPAWTAAEYPGTCERCGKEFSAGTAIRTEPGVGLKAECCP